MGFYLNTNQFRRSFSWNLLAFLCCLACAGDVFSVSTRRIIMATNDVYASMTKAAIASIIENTKDSLEIGIVTYTASWRWKNVPAELDQTFQSLERNDANRTVKIVVKEWYDYEEQLNSSAQSEIAEKWEQNRDRAPGILIRYSFLHDNPGRILFPGDPWQPYLWVDSDVVVNCDIGEIFEFANKKAPRQPLIGCDYELFNPKILNTQNLETQDRFSNLIRLEPMEFFPADCSHYKQALVSGGVVLFNPEFMFIKDHAPEGQNWYQKLWRQCLDHVADHKEYLITEEYDYTRALEKWSLLGTEKKVWDSEEEDFEISYEKNVVQWLPNNFNFNPGQFMICEYILDCIKTYKTWEEDVLQKNPQSDDIAKLSPEQKNEFCKSFMNKTDDQSRKILEKGQYYLYRAPAGKFGMEKLDLAVVERIDNLNGIIHWDNFKQKPHTSPREEVPAGLGGFLQKCVNKWHDYHDKAQQTGRNNGEE